MRTFSGWASCVFWAICTGILPAADPVPAIGANADQDKSYLGLRPVIYCGVNYQRTVEVALGEVKPDVIAIRTERVDDGLRLAAAPAPAGRFRIAIAPKRIGAFPFALVRTDTGVTLATSTVKSFTLRSSADKAIGINKRLPDDTVFADAELILTPLLPDLQIRIVAQAGRLSFLDGLAENWLDSSLFTPRHADGSGHYPFRFWQPPGGSYFAHSYYAFQDGVQINE